ncbi:MAG: hypothetical protein JWO90_1877, partial [Solirubrobacterales bacterium]|nr:hypothetical protein [Solirubrobacterales bacterium]
AVATTEPGTGSDQLHGDYGYRLEYPTARAYAGAPVTRRFGGAPR